MVDKGDCYFYSYDLQEVILKELKVEEIPVPFLNYKRGEMEPPLRNKQNLPNIPISGQFSIID